MVATLEDSRTEPSRKSSRKSANRSRAANPKARATKRKTFSPTQRWARHR